MDAKRVLNATVLMVVFAAGCAATSSDDGKTSPCKGPVCSTMKARFKQQAKTLKQLVHPEKLAGPHLGAIYSRSAQYHDGHRNPVIVIPGILGSRLRDRDSGRVVWGSFGLRKFNPLNPTDASLLALPMQPSVPLNHLTDHDYADSILSDAEINILGIPIQVEAYHGALTTLGVGGFRNDPGNAASLDSISYGDDHYTCFEFHYDWRRDNAENAARLGQFIRKKAEYVRAVRAQRYGVEGEPVKFDIVAHSMGGLIARYYLRYGEQQLAPDGSMPPMNWAGANNVEMLIQVGSPNAGSPQVVMDLVEGKKIAPCLPKYSAAILGTMPATYQLMPRPRHAAIQFAGDCPTPVNLYDVNTWERLGWGLLDPDQDGELIKLLPHAETRQERLAIARDHLSKSLNRAYQFHQAIDQPADPPPGTSIYMIAGDSIDTISKVNVDSNTGELEIVNHDSGDGTVLRTSALMDERVSISAAWQSRLVSPIRFEHTTFIFTDQRSLTSDPAFTDNVLNLLLEHPRSTRHRN